MKQICGPARHVRLRVKRHLRSTENAASRRISLGRGRTVGGRSNSVASPIARSPAHGPGRQRPRGPGGGRSEEHTSELQSLMRNSYAVFCLKKKKNNQIQTLLMIITHK